MARDNKPMKSLKELEFLRSALQSDSEIFSNEQFLEWIKQKNQDVTVNITEVPFKELRKWQVEAHTGNLVHETGKFFSIEGIQVETDFGNVKSWTQPIINQPEIGFLGIIVKKINGVLHFLMQAKIEPGNINVVQLSPTLQATKSNYSQVHKGKKPLYLEYFNGEKEVEVIVDQLQSEQGARFLKKRNRNIIVEISEDIQLYDNFCWVTLGQIKEFIKCDNIVNMDTRTVISCIQYGSYTSNTVNFHSALLGEQAINKKERALLHSILTNDVALNSIDSIISWLTGLKSHYELNVKQIPLNTVDNWVNDGTSIYHAQNKYFKVIGVNVEISNREVASWDQPIIKPAQEGVIAFVTKEINGVYHFLVQAKLEAGNFDIIELAPTVQCLTGNYRKGLNSYEVPFIDTVLQAHPEQVWYSSFQSEEGGRFYHEQNRNMIVEVGPEFPLEVPKNYMWMTLNQLYDFIRFNNYLNISARSLLSAIRYKL
ncbi:NDP-hexose 2,3-dehydratase family protein [Leeuwenhoekiella sp. UBA6783]|uniref:NDP-hexose 2,3-dehydratase family protein n=1 Tax=Leeuwenhoekiella sp. UBA6783 TaxID=1946747 RepID=UPI0025C4E055|nr:NDP-hexose 2,3-dehydratase family protein [Leeuwenhoekiella sp. UBA6783]|tara:strand:+ start:9131 stop:10582 length:1452 start_codon:yes stop_codon:yes gene_type:complete